MSKRKPVKMVRVAKLKDVDRSFDLEFWDRVGPEGRFKATCEMVKQVHLMRGGDPAELRMDRSVVRVRKGPC